ncbi:MAG: ribonuclease PH [Actinomycetota bacterium]|nr:ribonuclease PH [Actinomycetota bacterium]
MRTVDLRPGFMPNAEGSCLVSMGDTKVICTATVETSVPRWMQGRGTGWLTAEYSMLPRSSSERITREVSKGRVSGRTQEIQRLIGRSLRAITDLTILGEISIVVDCDVLQADGGTRTASITGGYVALAHAVRGLLDSGQMKKNPLHTSVAAISVGVIDDVPFLDLKYDEDSTAEVDMNVVMTGTEKFVEVQGTAEAGVFDRERLDALIDLAAAGIKDLTLLQQEAVGAGA